MRCPGRMLSGDLPEGWTSRRSSVRHPGWVLSKVLPEGWTGLQQVSKREMRAKTSSMEFLMTRINARLTIYQRGMTACESLKLQDMCNELKAKLEDFRNALPNQEKVHKLF